MSGCVREQKYAPMRVRILYKFGPKWYEQGHNKLLK